MKRIILFSQPTEKNIQQVTSALFPSEFQQKTMAYMPSNGINSKQKYTDYWKKIASQNQSGFSFVDNTNTKDPEIEIEKLSKANVLIITGGNTFELLNNIRQTGLDRAIVGFCKKDNFVIAGFSAGAIIFSPKIDIAGQPSGIDPEDLFDKNIVGITDLTGLNIIDFEILPHYKEESDRKTLEEYQQQTNLQVRPITDDEVLVIDK